MNYDEPRSLFRKQLSTDVSSFVQPKSVFLRSCTSTQSDQRDCDGEFEASFDDGQCNREKVDHGDRTDLNVTSKIDLNGWISDIMESMNDPFIVRKDHLAIADICCEQKRPRLVINKQNIKECYGYEFEGTTYLWAEEALFLLEVGKLDIYVDQVPVSVQRARSLLLHSKHVQAESHSSGDFLTCDTDEYQVYKYFSKLGFIIRRRDDPLCTKDEKSSLSDTTETIPQPDVIDLDVDYEEDDVMQIDNEEDDEELSTTETRMDSTPTPPEPSTSTGYDFRFNGQMFRTIDSLNRGRKRKADNEDVYSAESDSDSVESLSDESSEKFFFIQNFMPDGAGISYIQESHEYTVTEADSDIEIVDEVIASHCSVGIKEIESNDDSEMDDGSSSSIYFEEPQPGPSSASKVIVDLVSSDDESDCDLTPNSTANNVWADFSSVNTFQMKFPSSHLLPESIPYRTDDKFYTFKRTSFSENLKTNSDEPTPEGIEIDKIVDELNLDGATTSPTQPEKAAQNGHIGKRESEKISCGSWKEWRRIVMTEARDALNESLLGASTIKNRNNNNEQNVASKLNLWNSAAADVKCKKEVRSSGPCLCIPFDLFPQVNKNTSKKKFYNNIQPMYHVAVVRTLDPVLNSSDIAAQVNGINDNIPLIIALVNEASEVLVLSSDLKKLPSLFI